MEGDIISIQGNVAEAKQHPYGAYIVVYNPEILGARRMLSETIDLENQIDTKSIDQEDILRVFIEDRKLIVETIQDRYQARCPLQALEEILDPESFLRISRSEIINLDYVSGFDMSIKGTIKVKPSPYIVG